MRSRALLELRRVLPPLLALGMLAAPAAASVAAAPAAEAAETALVLGRDSIAYSQVVALGRDVLVDGEARSDVVALDGAIRVSGRVEGDVIALGGDVQLAGSAVVGGDVFVLGGRIEAAPGAEIGGRSVSHPTISAAWLTLLEGPALGLEPASPLVVGAKLGLLAAWMVLVLVFFAAGGREMLSTSASVAEEPFRNFTVGLTGVLTLVLTALFLVGFAAALVGAPLLVLIVLLALVLKLWGMVAVFHALGVWLGSHLLRRRLTPLHAATLGLAALGVLKLVPYVGVWVWTVATLIGVGATLVTKFGRREAWLQAAATVG